MQYDAIQYGTTQYSTMQYNTKIRPHKFLFDHSAGIAELVEMFSIPSWAFLLI